MAQFDLVVRGGTIVDGTGAPRFEGDIGICGGTIRAIGDLRDATAMSIVDARGLIVAPGIIDPHTHYDAHINWDPYCAPSGWHGITTVVMANCGFGYAPARRENQKRYMQMMENTEQVPYVAQAAGLSWDWETFPDWLNHLRRLKKGVNVASYLPMNPLMIYVMGVDAAKTRPATRDERRKMRELLHEAMDAGAIGFSFSYLGIAGNTHVDYDRSPMPTDVMAKEEAYNLCEVLRERGEGIVQLLADLPAATAPQREFLEELARRSQRPVFHNVVNVVEGRPDAHRSTLRWIDDCAARGLDIWTQLGAGHLWFQFNVMDYNNWDHMPVFRLLSSQPTREEKLALLSNAEYRERMKREYDPIRMLESGSTIENFLLENTGTAASFAADRGRTLQEIATERGVGIVDLFVGLLVESELSAEFTMNAVPGYNVEHTVEVLRHPRVIPGLSDGGAHCKFFSGGHWAADLVRWLSRDEGAIGLEEIHSILSKRTASIFGFKDRGTLEVDKIADLFIYDYQKLGTDPAGYKVVHDLPGGDWRRLLEPTGISYMIVNGQVTFDHGKSSSATPGKVISATASASRGSVSSPQAVGS